MLQRRGHARACAPRSRPAAETPPARFRLRRLLAENKTKLHAMEAELSLLRRDMKLTSAPKKQAMELMRRKIEVSASPLLPPRPPATRA